MRLSLTLSTLWLLVLIGCSSAERDEIMQPNESASRQGIEGYEDVQTDARAVHATLHHKKSEFNGMEFSVSRNDSSGVETLVLEKPGATATTIEWNSKSGRIKVSGPKGTVQVSAFRSFESGADYEKAATKALSPYEEELKIASKAAENLTPLRAPRSPATGPLETFEPKYLSPDEVRQLKERMN